MKIKFHRPATDRLLIVVILLLIGLQTAIMWDFGQKVNILWAQSGNGNVAPKNLDNTVLTTDIKFYIQTAIKSLYSYQPSTDAAQSRVYFPEANFYVPLNSTSRKLVYSYADGINDFPKQLTITSVGNVNSLPSTFADVPCIQRHVQVNINSQQDADGKLAAAVKLADGRTLYIYKHQVGNCSDPRWSFYSADDIVNLLKQAQSY